MDNRISQRYKAVTPASAGKKPAVGQSACGMRAETPGTRRAGNFVQRFLAYVIAFLRRNPSVANAPVSPRATGSAPARGEARTQRPPAMAQKNRSATPAVEQKSEKYAPAEGIFAFEPDWTPPMAPNKPTFQTPAETKVDNKTAPEKRSARTSRNTDRQTWGALEKRPAGRSGGSLASIGKLPPAANAAAAARSAALSHPDPAAHRAPGPQYLQNPTQPESAPNPVDYGVAVANFMKQLERGWDYQDTGPNGEPKKGVTDLGRLVSGAAAMQAIDLPSTLDDLVVRYFRPHTASLRPVELSNRMIALSKEIYSEKAWLENMEQKTSPRMDFLRAVERHLVDQIRQAARPNHPGKPNRVR